MPAFIGRVAIKLAVKGGSLRWKFDSDAELKLSLFCFFRKILSSIAYDIRNRTNEHHNHKNNHFNQEETFTFSTCIEELLLGEKVRAIWKAAVVEEEGEGKTCPGEKTNEKNKRKSSIKGRDNERERKTCPGEKSIEIINQSLRQRRTFTWFNFIECG